MFRYRIATANDLEKIWNKNIAYHPDDHRWWQWKEQYIDYNNRGLATTFVVVDKTDPVGELTILFSPECKAVDGRKELANGKDIANMNAFRIEKHYEDQGHISALFKLAEDHAKKKGIKKLTIGVEAKETRNLAIYLHFGFTKFVSASVEENEGLILYYSKDLKD